MRAQDLGAFFATGLNGDLFHLRESKEEGRGLLSVAFGTLAQMELGPNPAQALTNDTIGDRPACLRLACAPTLRAVSGRLDDENLAFPATRLARFLIFGDSLAATRRTTL